MRVAPEHLIGLTIDHGGFDVCGQVTLRAASRNDEAKGSKRREQTTVHVGTPYGIRNEGAEVEV